MMCPPIGIELVFIITALSLLLGMLLAWGWGAIVMKAALAARPAAETQAQLQRLQQLAAQRANQTGLSVAAEAQILVYEGHMLDARVSAVYLVLGIFFIYCLSLLRMKNPKFMFTQLFGIIITDIFMTIGPLLPSFNGTLPKLIIEPASIGLGLAFLASLVLFPQSTSQITIDSMAKIVDMLKVPLKIAMDTPASESEESQRAAKLNGTKQGLLAQWSELQPILGFLKLDFSVKPWNNKDIMSVEDDLRKAFIGIMNLLNFQLARLGSTLQSQRALAMINSDASSQDNSEGAILKEDIKAHDVGYHQLTEFSVFLKAINDADSAEIRSETRTLLHENSSGIIQICVDALDSVKECFQAVNSARLFTRMVQKTHDKNVQQSEGILERLRAARATYVEKTTDQLLLANAELFDADGKIKTLDSHLSNRFRAIMYGMNFEEHVIGVVDGTISLLEKTASLYKEKSKTRIWFPAGIRHLAKWIFRRADKAPINSETAYSNPDTIVDQSDLLQQKLGLARGIRKKPRSRMGRIIRSSYGFFVSPDSLYALRMVVVSIALVIPAVLPKSAGFFYRERGLWALIMGQTTMLAYMADFTYAVIGRIIGTVVGGVMGLLAWYIGSGDGEGNSFGLAASIGVLIIPIIYARAFLPRQYLLPTIMGAATFMLVVGYSFDYA